MNVFHNSRIIFTIICLVVSAVALSATAEDDKLRPAQHLTVAVGNRLYPDFHETHSMEMHQRVIVGDTDYSFEVVDFYPHFARIDSTKQVISLSDEPTNVAFKFVIYENDSIVDTSWSFFSLQVPHFARTSYLYFNVFEFEYRGEIFKQGSEGQSR
jgi:hypothetical protein